MNPAYRPMLATLIDKPFDDKGWVFETKWDAVRLWSRNGIDVTPRYAVLLPALQKIDGSCVIDGEICALDAHGRSRFQLLQNALNKEARLLYVVFDALFVGGKDIRAKPLLERHSFWRSTALVYLLRQRQRPTLRTPRRGAVCRWCIVRVP
jgi:bifunctional non-homologous end joining protein LigD